MRKSTYGMRIGIHRAMNGKVKFEDKLSVVRVRRDYAAPYLKHRYFNLKRKDIKSKKLFIQKIESTVLNWPPGCYYLRMSDGKVFARFEITVDGKVRNFYKHSPATGRAYPIWQFFRN